MKERKTMTAKHHAVTTTCAQEVAITIFRLKAGLTVDQYRGFSLDTVRAGMQKMPAVEGFLDLQVCGAIGGADGWQLVEIIKITSREEFLRDNATVGADLAQQWEDWVEDYKVLFLKDLNASEFATNQLRITV
jgi:hypothetical protein